MKDTPTNGPVNRRSARGLWALALTAVTPLLFSLHVFRVRTDSYAAGEIDRVILPGYAIMLITAAVGTGLAYRSRHPDSPATIASRLLGRLSLALLAVLAIPLFLLDGFGPS